MYDRAIEHTINSKLNYKKANYIDGNARAAYILGWWNYNNRKPEE